MQVHGDVAHLGERLNGIQEVEGSIPFVSTSKPPARYLREVFLRSILKNQNHDSSQCFIDDLLR